MKTNSYFMIGLLLSIMMSSCSSHPKPDVLHLTRFDFDELIAMGYTVIPPDQPSSPFLPQEERIKRLFTNSSPVGYLSYKNGDTTSIIYYVDHDRLISHNILISYHDQESAESAFNAWAKGHDGSSLVGMLVSDRNAAILIQDRYTNQYKVVRSLPKDSLVSISYPIVYTE